MLYIVVTHDHHGGVALVPALAGIRTARLFADRDELVLAHDAMGFLVAFAGGRLDADPGRLLGLRIVLAVRLFRVTLGRDLDVAQRFFPAIS